ncbi:MAG: hypothetical protein RLZZ360_579 [Candidatus Parcubacteria bacterium]|jgi:HEPN domain-containing protein
MLSADDLFKIAKCRFEDAKLLADHKRFDSAAYLCGYALELILKRQISIHLDWKDGYPEFDNEFKHLASFKTHDLSDLLHLSGLELKIKSDTKLEAYWRVAKSWQVDQRYRRVGEWSESETLGIIEASRNVLNWISKP